MIHIEFAEFDPFRINREKYLLEFDRSKSSKKKSYSLQLLQFRAQFSIEDACTTAFDKTDE
jgi:hypothetical protein